MLYSHHALNINKSPSCDHVSLVNVVHNQTYLSAMSLGACWRSRRLVPCCRRSSMSWGYWGCCLVTTRAGWSHTLRRYCSAWM